MIELDYNTTLEDLKNNNAIIAYHSSGDSSLYPRENLHCGSYKQSLFRADYKINDEGFYKFAYIYKVKISLKGLLDDLMLDDGYDANLSFEDTFKSKCNVLAYKNVSEGVKSETNLSLLILNIKNILSYELDSIWSGSAIEHFLYEDN